MKKIMMSLLILLVLVTGCASQDENEDGLPKKVKIGTIRVPNDKAVARSMDYFDDLGIETEFIFFDSGVAANQAFSSGSVDFAAMGHTNGVVALANELPVKLIWLHEILGSNEALVVKDDSDIETIEDLKGMRIATTFSSTSHLSLMKALEMAGIAEDVELLDMETAEIVAAWERGDVQAAYSWEPGLSKLKDTGRVLIDSEQLAKQGIVTANIELVHNDFAEKYPDLVHDYIKTLDRAVELYQDEPDVAINAAAENIEISVEEAKEQMSGTLWLRAQEEISKDYLGTKETPGVFHNVFLESAEFLFDQGNINRVPSIEEVNSFIDTSYIETALGDE